MIHFRENKRWKEDSWGYSYVEHKAGWWEKFWEFSLDEENWYEVQEGSYEPSGRSVIPDRGNGRDVSGQWVSKG